MRQQGWIAMDIASRPVVQHAHRRGRIFIRAAIAAGLCVVAAIAAASIAGPLPPGSEELLTAAPFRW